MGIGLYCNRDVVTAAPGTSVLEAAQLMRQHHVGTLLVVEKNGEDRARPVGIVTDRDLVLGVMAPNLKPETIVLSDIMQDPLYAISEEHSVRETIRIMRGHGVRRIPVVNRHGVLQGIVSMDDLILLLAEELQDLSQVIRNEKAREESMRK